MTQTNILDVKLPVKVISEANTREVWQAKMRRVKSQRLFVGFALQQHLRTIKKRELDSYEIELTRIAPRKLDSDNLQYALVRSFKAVRDGIADALGIDDGSSMLTWKYTQRRGKVREYAVNIKITGYTKG